VNSDLAYILTNSIFSIARTQMLGNGHLNEFFRNGGGLFAKLASMLNPVGTTPDDRSVVLRNSAVGSATFLTNQKATQYILGIVPGGLSDRAMFSCSGIGAADSFRAYLMEGVLRDNNVDVGGIRKKISIALGVHSDLPEGE